MRSVALAFALWLGLALPAAAQPAPAVTSLDLLACDRANLSDATAAECQLQHHQASGLTVSAVSIDGAWSRRLSSLPLKVGDTLTPESLSTAMEALRTEITLDSALPYFKSLGQVSVLYISVEFSPVTASSTVEVKFIPRYVDLSLVKVGDNVLPIPRSNPPPFEDVPGVVRVFKPSVLAAHDQAFGTSVTGAIDTDMPLNSTNKLNVSADGRVSLDEPLHTAKGAASYQWHQDEGSLRAAGVSLTYEDAREPLASSVKVSDGWAASGQLTWKLAANTRLYLDATARDSHEGLTEPGVATVSTPGNDLQARVLYESIPRSGGFLRGALWIGNSSAGGSVDTTHQTAVLRAGWEKEFAIAPSQTIGLEVMAGGGYLWGSAPAYDRFFAGNSAQKFLYDAPTSTTMTDIPTGPPLRSFGEGAAGIAVNGNPVGGTRFWHVNVDLTIPIAPWSSALIPNESADLQDPDGHDITLKQLMARQVDVSGPSFMESALMAQGMTFEQAQQRTNEVMDEIRPAAHYIIDDANLIAVKPLLVVDAAGLSGADGSDTWLSLGLGLQVTVVTAKFEFGYSQTVHGPTFGDRGAAFARLTFQRLF